MSSENIITAKYRYKGTVYKNLAHKYGEFKFINLDTYKGECKYGKIDGFGTYSYADGTEYTGFFSFGTACGIGTLSNAATIYKGTWRLDKKHGNFYKTDKLQDKTYRQVWIRDVLISSHEVQYIPPERLGTAKQNKKINRQNKTNATHPIPVLKSLCIGCSEQPANMAIINCGHVALCAGCVKQCTICPMCRGTLGQVIKIYVC